MSLATPLPIGSTLDRLKAGRCGKVRDVRTGADTGDRLRAMGICIGRTVMVVCTGDPLILRVLGSRIGISARLAAEVWVEACPEDFCDDGES